MAASPVSEGHERPQVLTTLWYMIKIDAIDHVSVKLALSELRVGLILRHIERRVMRMGWRTFHDNAPRQMFPCFRMWWIRCWRWISSIRTLIARRFQLRELGEYCWPCPFHGGRVVGVLIVWKLDEIKQCGKKQPVADCLFSPTMPNGQVSRRGVFSWKLR